MKKKIEIKTTKEKVPKKASKREMTSEEKIEIEEEKKSETERLERLK